MIPTSTPISSSHRLLTSLAPLGLLTLFAACSCGPKVWVEDSQEFSFAAKDIQSVQVKTHNGHIKTKGMAKLDKAKVAVRIRAGGKDEADARACLAAIQLKVEASDGVLHAGYEFEHKRGWQAQVFFTIQQPTTAAFEGETHNGAITLTGIKANIHAQSHNGSVLAKGCEGGWDLNTHNGGIVVTGSSTRIKLETHNGAIKANLDASGPISGSITTHNGGLDVALAKESSALIHCRTQNGRINNTLPLTDIQIGKRNLQGTLGNSQTRLTLQTHNGSIRLRPSDS